MCISMTGSINDFTKLGFNRLLKPFENSIADVMKITRAFSIAIQVHSGQLKKGNKVEPYINHPLRVALILTEELHDYDTDLICAAILHDSLGIDGKPSDLEDTVERKKDSI